VRARLYGVLKANAPKLDTSRARAQSVTSTASRPLYPVGAAP